MTQHVRTRGGRRASRAVPPSERPAESPLDRAKAHEVVWPRVTPLFAAARRITNASFVYVISEGDEGPVKIGRAKDPIQRLRGMQTGNPRRLRVEFVLIGEKNLERLLHEMWEPSAIRSALKAGKVDTNPGTEWFKPEIRAELFDVLDTAVTEQAAYIESGEALNFDRCTEIVYDAHARHGVKVHERDETRLLAQGAGYVVHRHSMVKYFRNPGAYRPV